MKRIRLLPIFMIMTLLVLCFSGVTPAFAANTDGPNNPGTGIDKPDIGDTTWSNPEYITSPDHFYASAIVQEGDSITHYLKGIDYGFAIPDEAMINGITVNINRKSDGNSIHIRDYIVRLVNHYSFVGENKAEVATNWPSSMAAACYGGATDLWGTSWTPADINSPGFGVALSVINRDHFNDLIASVDYMQITIAYTVRVNPTLSLTNSPLVYNGSTQVAIINSSVEGIVSNIKYNGSEVAPTTTGTYVVTADFIPTDSANYNNLTGASAGNLVINRAPLTVTGINADKVYDGTTSAKLNTDSASLIGIITNDKVGLIVTNTSATFEDPNAGSAKSVTVNGLNIDNPNYSLSQSVIIKANISQRPIAVAANAVSKYATYPDPPLTYQITSGSLIGSDAFTGSLSREPGENPGEYNINQGSLSLSSNYELTFNRAKLIIMPLPSGGGGGQESSVTPTPTPTPTNLWPAMASQSSGGESQTSIPSITPTPTPTNTSVSILGNSNPEPPIVPVAQQHQSPVNPQTPTFNWWILILVLIIIAIIISVWSYYHFRKRAQT
jgi:hypothetical protein